MNVSLFNMIEFIYIAGLDHVAENILSFLDARSLTAAQLVCTGWLRVISEGMLWKKLIERKVHTDSLWRGLAERRNWIQYLFCLTLCVFHGAARSRHLFISSVQNLSMMSTSSRSTKNSHSIF